MLSYEVYKVLHLLGIFLVLTSLGGVYFHQLTQPTSASLALIRKKAAMIHGIGMSIVLIAGFGLLAKLGIMSSMGFWVWGKLVIWLILGVGLSMLLRLPRWKTQVFTLLVLLASCSAILAIYKPS